MRRSVEIESCEDPRRVEVKIKSEADARAYGRIAAVMGVTLKNLDKDVAPEFHAQAKQSYERRLMRLHGSPF